MKRNSFFWILLSMSALSFLVATKNVAWAQPASAPAASAKPDDSAINAAVQSALQKETWMPGTDIHATTENGIVTLSGPARSHGDIQRAVHIARKVPGVTRAKSQIKVMPLPNPADFPK
jgi:hyperosmotically inducible protein